MAGGGRSCGLTTSPRLDGVLPKVEEYHKSLKSNASLAKSPTKTIRTQSNHCFASRSTRS